MKKDKETIYKIDSDVLKDYVETINSLKEPMSEIKNQLSYNKKLKSINNMSYAIKELSAKYPNDQTKIYTDTMKQMMNANNGMLSTRMIEPLNISRQYLSVMESNNDIEKISRGIYLASNALEDSYFSFQQKYKKIVYSHMNALYFYGMTEEFPYNYTITVPQSYHVDTLNQKCNIFYVSDDIYEIGLVEIETPNGNKVRTYDIERSICDIIRSKRRMDLEQVKKTLRKYVQSKDKNLAKLSTYAEKMGIKEKVMEMIGAYYE